jgi:hypothetical protein
MRLERLKISAFTDKEFQSKDGDDFVVWMNPQSYQRKLSIRMAKAKEVNAPGSSPTYMQVGDETLDFKLIFDTTGLVLSPLGSLEMPADGVSALIEPLLDKIARVTSGKSQPNFIQLSWAQLQFRCLLSSCSINYKLFRPDGTAIRAEVSLSFTRYTSAITLSRTVAAETKDSTRVVTLVEGATLPALCQEIYGDSSYYLRVAAFNGIFSFRNLKSGTQLVFPPEAEL